MSFHLTYAWAAAGAFIAFLLAMGVLNRRSGWQRKHEDMVLENLSLWASTTLAEPAPPKPSKPLAAPEISVGLTALHSAVLQQGSGPAPAPAPATSAVKQQEREMPEQSIVL